MDTNDKPKPTHIALSVAFAKQVRAILGQMPADTIMPVLQEWAEQPAVTLRTEPTPVVDPPPQPDKGDLKATGAVGTLRQVKPSTVR